jgi:RNA polymerase subunit RPABC4/transcription elongation factor Spt4
MSDFLPFVKWCPSCGAEFRPEIETCSDCGEALVSRPSELPEGSARPGKGAPPELPSGDYQPLTQSLDFETADRYGALLAAAGIPFLAVPDPTPTGFRLRVREEDLEKAARALGVAPPKGVPIDEESFPEACPACGTPLEGRQETCPECGLALSFSQVCESCGEPLSEDEDTCPRCSRGES